MPRDKTSCLQDKSIRSAKNRRRRTSQALWTFSSLFTPLVIHSKAYRLAVSMNLFLRIGLHPFLEFFNLFDRALDDCFGQCLHGRLVGGLHGRAYSYHRLHEVDVFHRGEHLLHDAPC